MEHVHHYLRSTQTLPLTGGEVYDLLEEQGSPPSQLEKAFNTTDFVELGHWHRSPNQEVLVTENFPCSVEIMSFDGSVAVRFRLTHSDSNDNIKATTGYSPEISTTGVHTFTLAFASPATWVEGDFVDLRIEGTRTGGHGTVRAYIGTERSTSHVEMALGVEPPSEGQFTANGSVSVEWHSPATLYSEWTDWIEASTGAETGAPTGQFDISDTTNVDWFVTRISNTEFELIDREDVFWQGESADVPISTGQFNIVDTTTADWQGEFSSVGQFEASDTSTADWQGSRANTTEFELSDTASIDWQGSRTSNTEFELTDTIDLFWQGESAEVPQATGQFNVADTTIIDWEGSRTSNTEFDITDASTISWITYRSSSATFDANKTSTINWSGPAFLVYSDWTNWIEVSTEDSFSIWVRSGNTWIEIIEEHVLTTSGGRFYLTDISTIEWDASRTSSTELELTDTVDLFWQGESSEIPQATGQFNTVAHDLVDWDASRVSGGSFAAEKQTSVGWVSYTAADSTFDVTSTSFVEWEGSEPRPQFEAIDSVSVSFQSITGDYRNIDVEIGNVRFSDLDIQHARVLGTELSNVMLDSALIQAVATNIAIKEPRI